MQLIFEISDIGKGGVVALSMIGALLLCVFAVVWFNRDDLKNQEFEFKIENVDEKVVVEED